MSCACVGRRADDGDDRQQSQIERFISCSSLSASCPALSRASRLSARGPRNRDGRHKPGHDGVTFYSARSIFTSLVILRHVSSSPLSQVFASSSDSLTLMLTSCLSNASLSAGCFEASTIALNSVSMHRLRRRRRRQHALPVQRADAREARLGHGRHVGIVRAARCSATTASGLQLAGLDHRRRARRVDERHLRVADHEIVEHAGGAGLVRDVDHVDAGAPRENFHVEVREAADAGAGVAHLAGILLRLRDQVVDILRRRSSWW